MSVASPRPFRCLSPEVCDVLKTIEPFDWGLIVNCEGTREDLVAAGLVPLAIFGDIGKSGQRTFRDEFDTKCTVRRRPKAHWQVERRICEEPCDPLDTRSIKLKCYRDSVPMAIAATEEILRRLRPGSRRP